MEGEPFSHQSNAISPTLTAASLSTLRNTHRISMAYYNNPCSYPTSSASGELEFYSLLSQMLATEEANSQAHDTFADQWNTIGRPGPMVGSPTSLRATASYGEHYW